MWDMGGLKSRMPVTFWTFLAGSLALAGIFPFAGFWSKDEVLYETLIHGLGDSPLLLVGFAFGLIAVVLTAFYTIRMVLLTFHGDPRTDVAEDPEPVRWNVKFPLVVLGILSVVAGALNLGTIKDVIGEENLFLHEWLDGATLDGELGDHGALSVHHYEEVLEAHAGYEAVEFSALANGAIALVLALVGVAAAWSLYRAAEPAPHMEKLGALRRVLVHNYYQDEYQVWLATGFTYPVARVANTFDQGVIDGLVDAVGTASVVAGERFRKIQTGVVTNYAALLALGLVLLILVFGLAGGWF